MLDLKRIVTRVLQYQNTRSSLTFQNFEQSLKYIAVAAYHASPLTEKLKNLFNHVKSACREIYNVGIIVSKHSRTSTPLSCDTSGSEFDENRNTKRGSMHSYSQKQFYKKSTVHTNINIALDINSALASHQSCSPRDTKSTSRIRISPKKTNPSHSHKSISQEVSPQPSKKTFTKKSDGYSAINEIKKFSQDFSERAKMIGKVINTDKKHYRTLSGGTYVLQSPRFGGGSTLIPVETDRYAGKETRRSVELAKELRKSVEIPTKDKNIEKLFHRFKENQRKITETKPSLNEPSLTTVRKHRNYIHKLRENTFTNSLVIRMIFSAWKSLKCKRY